MTNLKDPYAAQRALDQAGLNIADLDAGGNVSATASVIAILGTQSTAVGASAPWGGVAGRLARLLMS